MYIFAKCHNAILLMSEINLSSPWYSPHAANLMGDNSDTIYSDT